MKKLSLILSVILCLAMMLTFTSCGNTDSTDDTTSKVETPKTPEELIVGEWSCKLPSASIWQLLWVTPQAITSESSSLILP